MPSCRHPFASLLLFLLSLAFAGLGAGAAAAAAESTLTVPFAGVDLAVTRALPVGESVRWQAVPIRGGADLELERIRVFGPDAVLQVQREDGPVRLPVPSTVYLSGGIAGSPRSRAFVAVRGSGEVRGLVAEDGRIWIVERDADGIAARVGEVADGAFADQAADWRCRADELDADAVLAGLAGAAPEADVAPAVTAGRGAGELGALYTARVAFETDNEYLTQFGGNTSAAIDYIGDLVAFASTIYSSEVDTTLEVSGVNLWQAADPWQQSAVDCRLFDFGRYWNDNNSGVSRTIAHFLSGRATNAGIAWVGVLCSNGFNTNISLAGCSLSPNTDNYGGDYGYTSGIDGNFDINNPSPVWDIVATTHEIGHNFDSPHTHCYAGIGGNANPVDECFNGQCGQSGCWCGAASLPCANPGAGCGTVMSYCHLLGGGLGNISFTFGEGHPWGTAPDRVPARMSSHVVGQASANPGCLDFVQGDVVFDDGFESGNTSAWSAAVG